MSIPELLNVRLGVAKNLYRHLTRSSYTPYDVMASRKRIKRRQCSWAGSKSSKRFYKEQQIFNKEKYLIVRTYNGK